MFFSGHEFMLAFPLYPCDTVHSESFALIFPKFPYINGLGTQASTQGRAAYIMCHVERNRRENAPTVPVQFFQFQNLAALPVNSDFCLKTFAQKYGTRGNPATAMH